MSEIQKKASLVVILCPDTGEPLSSSRRNKPSQLGILGGKPDEGETALECAMREFYEESGHRLKDQPVLVMEALDDLGYFNSVYLVVSKRDIISVASVYKGITKEVEKGIHVSYNPWTKLLSGPFGAFNAQLLCVLMKRLATEIMLRNE